ncbi:MAG: DNA-processing protein DprA [Sedimentibacter sp.]
MESLNIDQKTLAWLNSANGMTNDKIDKLLEYFNFSTTDLWDNFEAEKYNLTVLKPETISILSKARTNFEERFLKKINDEKAFLVTTYDEDYPKKLKQIEGAPNILYYKGSLKNIDDISIAVVGSRKATAYGKWAAEKLTNELSQLGVNIISGLAAGIDAVAHKTAIKSKAKTVGVIGCGIDFIYPKSNESIYRDIEKNGGAVITEYTFGLRPLPYHFHDRNRIISGLSDGVLIIEAQEKSGTLITAGHAANQGREIFAVPGNIDSLYSKGTNALIKDGAKITTSINDIVEEILELQEVLKLKQNLIDYSTLSDDEMKIINCLNTGSKTIYEINELTKIDTGTILSMLTFLEMKGAVLQIQSNKFKSIIKTP